MKVLITTLNSKYIHSSLAIRYLKEYCLDEIKNIEIAEYTINQNNEYITGEIYKKKPDIVAFSCYIWNLQSTLEICQRLKLIRPHIKIVLGGPEVSYDGDKILEDNSYIDFIVYGEGEVTFKDLLIYLQKEEKDFSPIKGLIYRDEEKVFRNNSRSLIIDLDRIPSPFEGNMEEYRDRIVYYESSRGCPFNCQFCLSSAIKGVRFFPLERVKRDLANLIKAGVKQVKFVDRTFNARKDYALEIMTFIINQGVTNINFHFEVTAHLLDDEILDFLKDVPEGLFQFEIGVQSTNTETLKAIDRNTDFKKLSKVTERIKSYKNIHQHLDLIAGLPYENYESFKKSFNDVYRLKPDKLQLGFLKLLKGSGLRDKINEYGFKFLDISPYEVLENNFIKYEELLRLNIIEDLVEKYGNESSFNNTLEFIIGNYYETPFDFYETFSGYWERKEHHTISHSKANLYKIIWEFYTEEIAKETETFQELLLFDFIYYNKNSNVPAFLEKSRSL